VKETAINILSELYPSVPFEISINAIETMQTNDGYELIKLITKLSTLDYCPYSSQLREIRRNSTEFRLFMKKNKKLLDKMKFLINVPCMLNLLFYLFQKHSLQNGIISFLSLIIYGEGNVITLPCQRETKIRFRTTI
jgi:hypothetical protein